MVMMLRAQLRWQFALDVGFLGVGSAARVLRAVQGGADDHAVVSAAMVAWFRCGG